MDHKAEPWEELSREQVFFKYGRGVDKVMFKLPSGKVDEYFLRNEHDMAATFALTEDNRVVLVKQFRPGPEEILYELPGGYVDPGEDVTEAAARELLEETGYQGEITMLGFVYADAYASQKRYMACAIHCKKVSDPVPGDNEFLEIVEIPLEEFRSLMNHGKMADLVTAYRAMDYLKLL